MIQYIKSKFFKVILMKEIVINRNDANQRLDKFITKFMPKLPKSMLYKGVRKNCVKVNGKHIKDASVMLLEGDILTLYFKDEFFSERDDIKITDNALNIVYEDENIILINKPAGTVVHADDKGSNVTLIDTVKSYLYKKGEFNPKEEHSFSPALCNRLDQNTSGIIIAAKNADALREMNKRIKNRDIKKLYLCVVDGIMEGEGEMSGYLERHEKKVSVHDTLTKNSKAITTKYKVLASNNTQSLLEVELLTGRTHQIRAHLSSINHPLSGDKKYNSKTSGAYMLSSYKLVFDFKADGGVLDYLCGKEFSISVDFAKKFSSQKL